MTLKSYISPGVKIKRSKIQGLGLAAVKSFRKGDIVGIKNGHIFDKKQFKKLGGFQSDLGRAFLQIADNFFIGPSQPKELKRSNMFVNHSCDPNIGFLGNIVSVAMRDIRTGEELTNDYATWVNYPSYELRCNCGSGTCRKVITGRDWRQPKLQKKYKGFFSAYIQKKIHTTHDT